MPSLDKYATLMKIEAEDYACLIVAPGKIEHMPVAIPDKFAYEAAPAIAATAYDDAFISREAYEFLNKRYMLALNEATSLRRKVAAMAGTPGPTPTVATAPNAAKLADEIMARIERDRDYHGAAISRDALVDVAIMCGCVKS